MNSPSENEPDFELEPNEDIIERSAEGEPPLWLWAQTCPLEDCPCRTALVVVAKDRKILGEHVDVVREIWDDAEDGESFAQALAAHALGSAIVCFELDIDSADITMPLSDSAEVSPAVREVARLVDGELLDRLASLWYLGKEQDDLTAIAVEPASLKDYRVGQLLAWDEVFEGARMDVYREGEGDDAIEVEAIETYCVRPKCECNEVRIQFYELGEEESGYVGSVAIKVEEPVSVAFHAEETHRQLLEAFWDKYKSRHSAWASRLAHRADEMQKYGERLNSGAKAKKPWVSSSRKRQNKPRA